MEEKGNDNQETADPRNITHAQVREAASRMGKGYGVVRNCMGAWFVYFNMDGLTPLKDCPCYLAVYGSSGDVELQPIW